MRTIFAMGGGGFTMEPDNPALDRYIVGLPNRPMPRVCFLPTASGDPTDHISRFYEAFSVLPCEATDLSLFRLAGHPIDVRALLLSQDVIYVGGGSMRNMLAIWRVHRLDEILRECWEQGIVLAGLSAGAMCWFGAGITKSTGTPEPTAGLGLLPGSLSVHYDGEPERRPAFLEAVASGAIPDGFGADDGVGMVWRDGRLERAVSSRPRGRCVRVRRDGDRAVEEPMPIELLAARGPRAVPDDVAEFRAAARHRALFGR